MDLCMKKKTSGRESMLWSSEYLELSLVYSGVGTTGAPGAGTPPIFSRACARRKWVSVTAIARSVRFLRMRTGAPLCVTVFLRYWCSWLVCFAFAFLPCLTHACDIRCPRLKHEEKNFSWLDFKNRTASLLKLDKHFISSSKVSLIRLTQHSFSLFVGLLKILDNSGQMLGSSRAKENNFIRHVVRINTSVATLSLKNYYFLLVMLLLLLASGSEPT